MPIINTSKKLARWGWSSVMSVSAKNLKGLACLLILSSLLIAASSASKPDRKYSVSDNEYDLVKIERPTIRVYYDYMRDPGSLGKLTEEVIEKIEAAKVEKQNKLKEKAPTPFSYIPNEKEVGMEQIVGRISVPRVGFGLERLPLSPHSAALRRVQRRDLTQRLRATDSQP